MRANFNDFKIISKRLTFLTFDPRIARVARWAEAKWCMLDYHTFSVQATITRVDTVTVEASLISWALTVRSTSNLNRW